MAKQENALTYTYTDVLPECRRYVYQDSDADALAREICEKLENPVDAAELRTLVHETLQDLKHAPDWDYLPDIMLKVLSENPRGISEDVVAEILKQDKEVGAAAKAFKSLRHSQRDLVKLRAVDGLSVQEIAGRFHMTPGEVAASLKEGRDAFWRGFSSTLFNLYQAQLLSEAQKRMGYDSYQGQSAEDARSKMLEHLSEIARRNQPLNFGAFLTTRVGWKAGDMLKTFYRRGEIEKGIREPVPIEPDPESEDAASETGFVVSGPAETKDPLDLIIDKEARAEKRKRREEMLNLKVECLKAFLEELKSLRKPTEWLFVFIRYYLNNSPVVADFDKGLIPTRADNLPLDIAEGLAVDALAQKKQARARRAVKPLSQASIAAAIGASERTVHRHCDDLKDLLSRCCQQFDIEMSKFDALVEYQLRDYQLMEDQHRFRTEQD